MGMRSYPGYGYVMPLEQYLELLLTNSEHNQEIVKLLEGDYDLLDSPLPEVIEEIIRTKGYTGVEINKDIPEPYYLRTDSDIMDLCASEEMEYDEFYVVWSIEDILVPTPTMQPWCKDAVAKGYKFPFSAWVVHC